MAKFVLLEILEEVIYADETVMMEAVKERLEEMGRDSDERFSFTEIPVKLFHIKKDNKEQASTGLYAVEVDPETLCWKRLEA